MTTLQQALMQSVARLIVAGIPANEARPEARALLVFATALTPEQIIARPETPVSEPESQTFLGLIERRAQREPLAYLLGTREFYGLRFAVTPAVLIPRPETEFVVEAVLQHIQNTASRIVDVGTGSGAIAIAVAARAPTAHVWATDISAEALAVGEGNANRNGVGDRVTFVQGDLLAPIADAAPFAVIASNPPYIAPPDIEQLAPEVRDWEPRIALGIHSDNLHFYRRLALEAPPLLAPGGLLVVEVGQGQAHEVATLWERAGLEKVSTTRDYAGIERVVSGVCASGRNRD